MEQYLESLSVTEARKIKEDYLESVSPDVYFAGKI